MTEDNGGEEKAGKKTDEPVEPEYRVFISVPYYGTENVEKIESAVEKIFPGTVFEKIEGFGKKILRGEGGTLRTLRERLREQRIRDAAREHLRLLRPLVFFLNKQAAYVGKVNFSDGKNPMGDIQVEVRVEKEGDEEKVVEWLTYIPEKQAAKREREERENGAASGGGGEYDRESA